MKETQTYNWYQTTEFAHQANAHKGSSNLDETSAGPSPLVSVRRLPLHINDPQFAAELTAAFRQVGGAQLSPPPPADRPADHHTAAEGSAALAPLPKCPYLNAETSRGAILPGLYELVHSVGLGA